MVRISIDSGKSCTKVSYSFEGEERTFKMLSNVSHTSKDIPTTDEAVAILMNDESGSNKRYLVGEYGQNDYVEYRTQLSKLNEAHKILVIAAIVKVLDKCGRHDSSRIESVEIAVNTPVDLFKTDGFQSDIKSFYKSNGNPYEVEFKNKTYRFEIKRVVPMFEGLGAVLLNRSKYAGEGSEVISLDFGSLNTCFATFVNCKPVGQLSSNLSGSMEKLISSVEKVLIRADVANLTETNIQDIIKGSYPYHLDLEVQEEVDRVCEKFVKETKHKLVSSGVNINRPVVGSGGGAILLDRFVKKAFPMYEKCTDPLYANARAGLKLLN